MPAQRPRYLDGLAVGVVGLGQIGGSIIRRLARYRSAITVYGTDRNEKLRAATRSYCRWRSDLAELSAECDVLILALPVPHIIKSLSMLAKLEHRHNRVRPLAVFDTGTLKKAIIAAANRHKSDFDFVGLHPLAGGETNGWAASRSALFQNRQMIIFPGRSTRANRMAREFTALLGAHPARLDAATHDRIAALTIGLPHVLAFAAAGLADRSITASPLRGDSWASLTRVAQSDPAMVAGFLTENKEMQLRTLGQVTRRLRRLTERLERGDDRGVLRLLTEWGKESADG